MAYTFDPPSDAELASGKPGKYSVFRRLRDIARAIAEGASGADRIQQAAIDASAVGQAEIKTTTASGSIAVGASSGGSYSLTGGTYSMWTGGSDNGAVNNGGVSFGNGDTAAGVIGLYNSISSTRTYYADERYFQASPPYDLGDGEIPLFIYLLMNSNDEIEGTRVSHDPPWAYHGPTNIQAKYYGKDGVGRRMERQYVTEGINPITIMQGTDQAAKEEMLHRLTNDPFVELKIDHTWKNKDMSLYPHPFMGNDLTGNTIIMLDPVSKITEELAAISCACNAREIRDEILLKDLLIIDSDPLTRAGPPGVPVHGFRWK
ncbi:MAG: hypothetical protein KAJ19_08010 [Gammaproteobacteria bacterium]|nr:hypothetical protein [Gammaproteobacteria bacterium]